MKVLIDTNVLLDFFFKRDPKRYAKDVITRVGTDFIGAITVSQVKDVFYILRKEEKQLVIDYITTLTNLFEVIDVKKLDLTRALKSEMEDIEDAILAFAASRNKCMFIVSRNIKDFANAPIKVLSPEEFLKQIS